MRWGQSGDSGTWQQPWNLCTVYVQWLNGSPALLAAAAAGDGVIQYTSWTALTLACTLGVSLLPVHE